MKIWSRGIDYLVKTLSANLDCALESLTQSQRGNQLQTSTMTFFSVCNLFVVRFAATWKVRIWGTLCKVDVKGEGEYRNFIFYLNLI